MTAHTTSLAAVSERAAADLDQLARVVTADPTAIPERVIDIALTDSGSADLTAVQRRRAWADYVEAVRLRDDLDTGTTDWRLADPELTCPDPQQAAVDRAAGAVEEALAELLHGNGGAQ